MGQAGASRQPMQQQPAETALGEGHFLFRQEGRLVRLAWPAETAVQRRLGRPRWALVRRALVEDRDLITAVVGPQAMPAVARTVEYHVEVEAEGPA